MMTHAPEYDHYGGSTHCLIFGPGVRLDRKPSGFSTTWRRSPRSTFMRVSISLGMTSPVEVPTAVSS
jgi:hypothetical protein